MFSNPEDGGQTVDVYLARGEEARSSRRASRSSRRRGLVRAQAQHRYLRRLTFFAGARSDAFFFDFDGIKNLFDTTGNRNFTAPHFGWRIALDRCGLQYRGQRLLDRARAAGEHAWRAVSGSGAAAACGATARSLHVDRAGHPSVSSFFNTDDTKEEYNASEPVNDRDRWIDSSSI